MKITKALRAPLLFVLGIFYACSAPLKQADSQSTLDDRLKTTNAVKQNQSDADIQLIQLLNSKSKAFPRTQDSPPEYVDSLDFVAPCRTPGCSVASTGGHNLHWFVTRSEADSGRSYNVKGEDSRCWERFDWDSASIQITYDNCWWTPGYQYSRYADGRWLARIWKPGDSIVTDHTVFGGNWDSCTDTPIGNGQKRVMTFQWRIKDFDWGPAGKLDTIAVRQSYPHEPRIREHYIYARGHGLIAWNIEDDINPANSSSHVFNLPSELKPIPKGTKCVQVETPPDQLLKPAPAVATMPAQTGTSTSVNTAPVIKTTPTPAQSTATSSSATPAPATAQQNLCSVSTLTGGFNFVVNQPVYSCSKKYSFVFQADGNLVLYNTASGAAIWFSSTSQSGATQASFQSDGNLVVYRGGIPLWNSNTGGNIGAKLSIQDDGNLVIRNQAGAALWNSNTAGK